jgi:cation diffusion facilitator family transporter
LIEGAANLLVLLIKIFVGLATGSLAIIGDAIHSGSDLANNVMALLVMHSATKPPDREHPYGHRKYETLAVFVLASLLTVTAFQIVLTAIQGGGRKLAEQSWALPMMLLVLGINISISLWEWRQAKLLQSSILAADARHTLADVLTTVAVIVGWKVAQAGFPWVDSACAVLVAGLVMVLAYGLFASAIPVLVDRIALEPEELTRAVLEVEGVIEVRGVRSRWAGDAIVIDATVAVHPSLSMLEAHAIADRVEELLSEKFGVSDATVHVEPYEEES